MAYSTKFREMALSYCQHGITDNEVCSKLGVSKNTLVNWKKRLFTTGSLEKDKVIRKSGNPYKYKPNKIKELLEKNQLSESTKNDYTDGHMTLKPKKKKKKYSL